MNMHQAIKMFFLNENVGVMAVLLTCVWEVSHLNTGMVIENPD
jgi:hypothetical protein